MRNIIGQRLARLERAREEAAPAVFMWTDPDNPDAIPEAIELCGLSHEECLALLDAEDRLQ